VSRLVSISKGGEVVGRATVGDVQTTGFLAERRSEDGERRSVGARTIPKGGYEEGG